MTLKLILAPMAAVNSKSFRLLCKKYGADLIYTQMFYVNKINESNNVVQLLNLNQNEHPITIQLIGALKDDWESAVKLIEPFADAIDINLGCPESEALEKRAGSYLLNQPDQIKKIIQKVISSTNKPVTAKIRSGWKTNTALEIATLLQNEGIKAIAVHPRTKKQHYTGKADWKIIKELKQNLKIPVYGNGDVTLPGHAKAMIEQTKCDGIMIGRVAMKNPAIFTDIKYLLKNNQNNPKSISKKQQILDFLEIQQREESEMSLHQIKDHCAWIASDQVNSKEIKEKIRDCESRDEITKIVQNLS